MMHHQILSGPASTRNLMANLSLAIDEAMLTRKISGLHEQLHRTKNRPEHRARVGFIKHELVRLDNELVEIRQTADVYE